MQEVGVVLLILLRVARILLLLVLLFALGRLLMLLDFFFVTVHGFIVDVIKVLKLPDAIPLPLAVLRVCLTHDDDVRELVVILLDLVQLANLVLDEVVGQHCVVEVEDLAQVRVDDVGLVVDAEVFLAGDLDLHLSETLLNGGSTTVEIVVNVLDVDDDELGEPVST